MIQFTGIMHMNSDAGIVGLGYKHQLFIINFMGCQKKWSHEPHKKIIDLKESID